ncbi:MAG: hypothetical protein KGL39_36910 [Patescibacteria group bacterium]|nr:hypothetical protein [Patescibacteria group bacterium]
MTDEVFDGPSGTDLEMLREQMAGKILPRPAAEGIADMQARLTQLRDDKQTILNRLQQAETLPDDAEWDRVAELNRQIAEAETRLKHYQMQQEGLN